MDMRIKRVRAGAILPQYQTAHAAGFDFCACLDDDVVLASGAAAVIPTGVAVEIPVGYELQIRPRSGLAFKHNVTLFNSIGTIDADYRDEMMVKLVNHGEVDFVITPGMRIAQGIVAAVAHIDWIESDSLSATERRGGFGSTGLE